MPKVETYLVRMELGPAWMEWGLWGVFLASFLAATILPFSSEAVLVVMAAAGGALVPLFLVATLGNTLGGATNYGVGRWLPTDRLVARLRIDVGRAERWRSMVQRYGAWAALWCWLPVIGDPIAIALGVFRAPFWPSLFFMLVGKAVRYAVLLWAMRSLAGA